MKRAVFCIFLIACFVMAFTVSCGLTVAKDKEAVSNGDSVAEETISESTDDSSTEPESLIDDTDSETVLEESESNADSSEAEWTPFY